MLEVGAVVHAGREHHHRGLGRAGRSAGAQRLQQHVGIVGHGLHGMTGEQVGEQPHHHAAVLQHVRHARRHAQVVLQHVVHALALGIGGTHDVDAGDVGVDAALHGKAPHLGAVLAVVQHQLARQQARAQDFLVVVDVMQKAVERRHALHQACLHALPFMGRDDARNQVKGNEALGAGATFILVAVDGERDAYAPEDDLGLGAARSQRLFGLARKPLRIVLVVQAHIAAVERRHRVHLVKWMHSSPPVAACVRGKASCGPALVSHQCSDR
ncbi:MAG: hypothetical protein GAK34_03600 [Delftia tsuruhatensis]|nr:MAG: hypothetical protein GAK34_03600 [Delftia tsuruhatensis]